jgi:hypothetical protein
MNEYGRGFLTAGLTPGDQLFGTTLTSNGLPGSGQRVDSLTNIALPYAMPAIAGLTSTFITWQESYPSGSEIRVRYAADGSTLGPEQVVSSPIEGPTVASQGLFASGDGEGDAAVAWVQGAPAQRSIVAEQMFSAPGAPTPVGEPAYSRSVSPPLSWAAAREQWGPVVYVVRIDGQIVGQTDGTSFALTSPLIDGPHTWQVTATNLGGLQQAANIQHVFVDTTAPQLRIRLNGAPQADRVISLRAIPRDAPPFTELDARASGMQSVTVGWGDGAVTRQLTGGTHVYRRPGVYRIDVTAVDRAGNQTKISRYLRILP